MPVVRQSAGLLAIGLVLGVCATSIGAWWLSAANGIRPTLPLMDVAEAAPATQFDKPANEFDGIAPPTARPPVPAEADAAAVRATIRRMLPQATADEIEIWYQQFKDLPPGIVEDMLSVRSDIRKPGSALWSPLPSTSPQPLAPNPLALPADTGFDGPSYSPDEFSESIAALQEIRRVTLQNLQHTHTPGYRRRIAITAPAQANDNLASDFVDLLYLGTRLELRSGSMESTNNPLDVAIDAADGCPFLTVTTPKGPGFTRDGRLFIDAEGRLSIRFPGGYCPMSPEVIIDDSIRRVEIAANGNIKGYMEGSKEPRSLGQIQLTEFRDPTHLVYSREGWLTATSNAGPASIASVERWTLQAGCLESSNVDPACEQQYLNWVDSMLKLLTNEAVNPHRVTLPPGIMTRPETMFAPPVWPPDQPGPLSRIAIPAEPDIP